MEESLKRMAKTLHVDISRLAHYSRHIILIRPDSPASITLPQTSAKLDKHNRTKRVNRNVNGDAENKVSLTEWVEKNVPSLLDSFTPSWWLANGHLQTIYSAFGNFDQVDKVQYLRTLLRLPDGGTIALDITPPNHESLPGNAPTVVVCHGLTGGSHESYVRNILVWVARPRSEGGLGGRGVVVNFRGCAGTPLTTPRFYSAATTSDLSLTLHYLRHLHPNSPLHGIGFSLGASVISHYLGETGSLSLLSSGIALGCPWDLTQMSTQLESGFLSPLIYSRALGTNLRTLYLALHTKYPGVLDNPNSPEAENFHRYLGTMKNMGRFGVRLKKIDDIMVSQVGGPWGIGLWPFKGADEYYAWASACNAISGVKRPLLSINAFDDPIVSGSALPITQFKASSHVISAITGSGGHLGWFSGPLFGSNEKRKSRWIRQPISEFLEGAVRDFGSVDYVPEVLREVLEDGEWNWVEEPMHRVQGMERVGWRVVSVGESFEGVGASGVLQGL